MLNRIKKELHEGKQFLRFSFLKGISHGLSFLVPILVAKFLSPDLFGSYSLSMMILYFFVAFLLHSANSPFVVYANEALSQTGKINKVFTVHSIILLNAIFIYALISVVFGNLIAQFAAITHVQTICLTAAYAGLCLRSYLAVLLMGLNKRVENAILEVVVGVISTAYVLILYFFFALSLENIFIMFLASPLLAGLLMWRSFDISGMLPLSFDIDLFKRMLHDTKWQVMGGVSLYLFHWGDNLVLRRFVTISDIGVYNFGYQFFKGTLMLVGMVNGYFLPFVAQNVRNPEKIKNYLYVKRKKIYLLILAGVCVLFFLIPLFIEIVFGSDYFGSIKVFRILLIGALTYGYSTFYTPIFSALKRFRFVQLTQTAVVALNIGLDYFFVQWYGYAGAAIATVVAYITSLIIYEIYFRKHCAFLMN